MGYGGPHAGFMSVADAIKRRMPGRILGLSRDSRGLPALRMALQTREQVRFWIGFYLSWIGFVVVWCAGMLLVSFGHIH